jgi:integrase
MPRRTTSKSLNVKSELVGQVIDLDRPKDFLTPAEIDKLLKATRASRHHFRDYALIRLMYRHGLR